MIYNRSFVLIFRYNPLLTWPLSSLLFLLFFKNRNCNCSYDLSVLFCTSYAHTCECHSFNIYLWFWSTSLSSPFFLSLLHLFSDSTYSYFILFTFDKSRISFKNDSNKRLISHTPTSHYFLTFQTPSVPCIFWYNILASAHKTSFVPVSPRWVYFGILVCL